MLDQLIFADNLPVLEGFPDGLFDLIYLDPPFNSDSDYHVLFTEEAGRRLQSRIRAFGDTWRWGEDARRAYERVQRQGPLRVAQVLEEFRLFLGEGDLLAYLAMMTPRLIELHRVLKSTGALFLHCDQTASHYLKVLVDSIFGRENFQNNVVWSYRRWPARSKAFQRMHDDLLFYVKDPRSDVVWNQLFEPLSPGTLKTHGTAKQHAVFEGGRRVNSEDTAESSPGTPMTDVWRISVVNARARERTGYPTQKPEALLDRILRACTNAGDLVLDPFCGCGTAVVVATRLGRHWVGIDAAYQAIRIVERRLLKEGSSHFSIAGIPTDLRTARDLARRDPDQFEAWALDRIGARRLPVSKRGVDPGIGGQLETPAGHVLVQVESGRVGARHVRELLEGVEREGAARGILLTLDKPTPRMLQEASACGFVPSETGECYPRVEVVTVARFLEGSEPSQPPASDLPTAWPPGIGRPWSRELAAE